MVVLSVLDTGLPTTPARTGFAPDRLADCCHLPDGGRRQHYGGVASVAGMGGMDGAIGGMLIAKLVGYLLQWTGSYTIPFLMAGSAYLIALGAIQLLAPKLEPVSLSEAEV